MELAQPQQKQKTSKLLLILMIIALAGIILLTYINKDIFNSFVKLSPNDRIANFKLLFKHNINENVKSEYLPYKDKILSITDTGVEAINILDKVEWNIKLDLQNPIVKVRGNYLYIADNGSKTLYVYLDSKLMWKKSFDGVIKNVRINKNGYVLVLKEAKMNGEVVGFNNKGVEILKKEYNNQLYLISADISEDNKKISVVCAYTEKSKIASKVENFELKSTIQVNSIPVNTFVKDDCIITDIKYFNNGDVLLVEDSRVVCIESLEKEKWAYDFKNSKVYNVNISSGSYVLIELNAEPKNILTGNNIRYLIMLDSSGVVQSKPMKIEAIKNMDIFENYFLANGNTKMYCISKGNILWSYSLGKDIKYIKGFPEKSQILVISKDAVEVFEVN